MPNLRNIFGFEDKKSFSKFRKYASKVTDVTRAKLKEMTITPKLTVNCPKIV